MSELVCIFWNVFFKWWFYDNKSFCVKKNVWIVNVYKCIIMYVEVIYFEVCSD